MEVHSVMILTDRGQHLDHFCIPEAHSALYHGRILGPAEQQPLQDASVFRFHRSYWHEELFQPNPR